MQNRKLHPWGRDICATIRTMTRITFNSRILPSPPPLILEVGERGRLVFLFSGGSQVDLLEFFLVARVLRWDRDGGRRSLGESHPVSDSFVLLCRILEGMGGYNKGGCVVSKLFIAAGLCLTGCCVNRPVHTTFHQSSQLASLPLHN